MAKLIGYAVVAWLVVVVGIQFIRPARTNPATDPQRTLKAAMAVPPAVSSVLERSCRDCHSNDTVWPWYSNVAPMSWMVIDHVNDGRRHFNYSDWSALERDKVSKVLRGICDETKKGEMPIGSYLLLHRDARLSPDDVQTLCGWTATLHLSGE
jgi:hypothetical protein